MVQRHSQKVGNGSEAMARPLPVNMLLAGTGAILLVSGLGGKSVGDVLKGSFGNLQVKQENIGSKPEQETAGAAIGGSGFEGSPVSFSASTIGEPVPSMARVAPAPRGFLTWQQLEREIKEKKVTRQQVREKIRELEQGR